MHAPSFGKGKINQHQNHTQSKSCSILAIHLSWITVRLNKMNDKPFGRKKNTNEFDAFFRRQLGILECTHNSSRTLNEIQYVTVVILVAVAFVLSLSLSFAFASKFS